MEEDGGGGGGGGGGVIGSGIADDTQQNGCID